MSPQRYTPHTTDPDPLNSLVRVHLSRPPWVLRSDLPSGATLRVPADSGAVLHAVHHGSVVVRQNGVSRLLQPGGAALITRDGGHSLHVSGEGDDQPAWYLPRSGAASGTGAARIFHQSDPTPTATVISVPVGAAGGGRSPLLDLLPGYIAHDQVHTASCNVIQLLSDTCGSRGVGDTALAILLAEVLLLLVLQQHFTGEHETTLRVLHDPRLMRAMSALHANLSHPWTVRELSRVAGMSESLFRSRLRAAVGEPWRTYVQRVRIRRAEHLLSLPDAAVAQVAANVGYQSESSFSRAFLTLVGIRPGQFIARHG